VAAVPNNYRKEFFAKDGTKFILREPRLSDAKQVLQEINSFVGEYHSGILINKKKTLREEKGWLKSLIEEIKKKEGVFLVVEADGLIIGGSGINRGHDKKSFSATFGICLIKGYRSKGIGKILMREILWLARKRMKGLECVELGVLKYNEKARALYKKMGFKDAGYVHKQFKEREGEYVDEYQMKLWLNRNN
jgi:ribosomal protein S18 acetylase RimI-like enzyme